MIELPAERKGAFDKRGLQLKLFTFEAAVDTILAVCAMKALRTFQLVLLSMTSHHEYISGKP